MKLFLIKYAGLLFLIWLLLIFLVCAAPGQYVPSSSWLDLLRFDKWVHAGIFFILSLLAIVFGIKNGLKLYGITILITLCVIYGGLLEIMQALVFSHRSSDWKDFVANTFGCFIAWLFYRKIKKKFFVNGPAETDNKTFPE
jgi:hypothetical protein